MRGGAVEVLTEYLIDGNDKEKAFSIDLYTINDDRLKEYEYKNTNIVIVNIHYLTKLINKIVNTIYKIFRIKKWKTSFNREVIKLLKKRKYDYVIIQNNILIYEDIYYKTNNKKNLIYIIHNNVNDGDETHSRIAAFMGETAYKVLAVSNYTKNNFLEISKNANVDVLYNCIEIEKYVDASKQSKREQLRSKYGIKNSDYVFMYSGRIDKHKGVLELVKAFKRFDHNNTKLLIVGKSWFDESQSIDDYTQEIKRECESVKDRIIFTDYITTDEMPYMYQVSDCLVIPSLWEEPFGVVALEGMASKLPIIATNSGGLVEIVDESCAYMVNKEKHLIDGLYFTMKTVIEQTEKSREKGEYGHRIILNRDEFNSSNYFHIFCKKIGY